MHILITGAGPTGLTAAVELSRLGFQTTVIDQSENPSLLSRAVGILPKSLYILKPSGVTDLLLTEGIKIREGRFFLGTEQPLSISLQGGHPEYDFLLALAQDRTEALLRQVYEQHGGVVHYGSKLTGLRQTENQVFAQINDGEEQAFDYLIGADGVHSTVRKSLDIGYDGFQLPETWSIADVDAINWPHAENICLMTLSAGRIVVVVPLAENRYRVVSNTPAALETLPVPMEVQKVRRTDDFHISIRQVHEYQRSRVFLAGDAAHCHSPAGGRGMNLGIADAADLAQRFQTGTLDGYQKSRSPEGAHTIKLSERLRKTMTSSNPFVKGLRWSVLKTISKSSYLQRKLARIILTG
ncbi:Pentachlorophenol 4-monooxygenase [Polystyrenella longa]|uniref:Pentachlorophenol 4-monooxygenase n=1 Tax=Polystyrenella longa TaxID=2528007 RepID=A0A518CJH9_9PLAN|nr:NAD(P)/FAD-dependent oxidoreductase [Polystyrenella longa]QDU79382.1 Pentachlorophenol 4-monooxygenase [Polystyrenella longa]